MKVIVIISLICLGFCMGIACKVFIKGNEPVYILEQVNRFVVEDAKEEKKSRETIVNNILADYYDYISCIDDEK